MSDDIKKLNNIGVEQIYKDTHIPREYIKAILDENFDMFSKVQFLGFLNILQREYDLKLKDLKTKALDVFQEEEGVLSNAQNGVFASSPKPFNPTPIYIFVGVIIFVSFIYFGMNSSNKENEFVVENKIVKEVQEKIVIPNKTIDKEKHNVIKVKPILETNTTKKVSPKIVQKKQIVDKKVVKEPLAIVKSFEIKTKSKVWVGYIDLTNYKKHQTVFKNNLKLDPKKEWLLIFGHPYINMYVDGQLKTFKSKNTRFHYKNGKIDSISSKEFKQFNKGRAW